MADTRLATIVDSSLLDGAPDDDASIDTDANAGGDAEVSSSTADMANDDIPLRGDIFLLLRKFAL